MNSEAVLTAVSKHSGRESAVFGAENKANSAARANADAPSFGFVLSKSLNEEAKNAFAPKEAQQGDMASAFNPVFSFYTGDGFFEGSFLPVSGGTKAEGFFERGHIADGQKERLENKHAFGAKHADKTDERVSYQKKAEEKQRIDKDNRLKAEQKSKEAAKAEEQRLKEKELEEQKGAACSEAKQELEAEAEAEANAKQQVNALNGAELGKEAALTDLKEPISELIKTLSPEELKEMAENPNKFVEELKAAVEAMPNSSEKEALLLAISPQELANMLQNAAKAALEAEETVKHIGKEAIASDVKEAEAEAKTSAKEPNSLKKSEQGEETLKEAEGAEAKDALNEDKKANEARGAQDKTAAKNGKDTQEQGSAAVRQESLRDEFNRIHGPSKAETEAAGAAQSNMQGGEENSEIKPMADAMQSIIQLFSEAEKGAKQSLTPAQRLAGLLKTRLGEGNTAENANLHGVQAPKRREMPGKSGKEGQNSSFSFGYGTKEASGSLGKNGNTAAVKQTSTVFAEMLEKAQLIKNKNGAKVLNLELEQSSVGKLSMKLSSKDGSVEAKVLVEDSLAKAKLDELVPQLKQQLFEQGVNLAEITVDISSGNTNDKGYSHSFNGKKNSFGLSKLGTDSAEEIIAKNFLPNLRRSALYIQAIDTTV